jgi:hypothetical protein
MTIHIDDRPDYGAFTYRFRGFSNQTTKHYFRHYSRRLVERIRKVKDDDYCNGNMTRHQIVLNLFEKFKQTYNEKARNLALMHYVENSHNTESKFHWLDNDIYEFLKNGNENGFFENTVIFLFSDHGPRFNVKGKSSQHHLEERFPFFSIYIPSSFKDMFPEKYANFLLNKNLLSSPFDIYATVRDLTCLDSPEQKNKNEKNRSISLFDRISPYRNCEDIGISQHYCTCIEPWQPIDIKSKKVLDAVQFTIESMNTLTNNFRHLCMKLQLDVIFLSEILDKNGKNILKIEFKTRPNKGIYETIVYESDEKAFEFHSRKFSIRSRHDISRIDAYGDQPRCLLNVGTDQNLNLDLRKFCYCFNFKRKGKFW